MHPEQKPTFLPLTVAASGVPERTGAEQVQRRAREADVAAAECWAALLGDCESPERRALPSRLRALAEATSVYVGPSWRAGQVGHQRRVAEAQLWINDALREGDGAEFAEAFVGYDQAVATAVVSVPSRLESPTP